MELERDYHRIKSSGESYLISLLDDIPDGFFIFDDKGMLTFGNKGLAEIFGYQDPDEMIGVPFLQLVIPDCRKVLVNEYKQAKQKRNFTGLLEIQALRKDGNPVFIQLNGTPIWKDGQIAGAKGIIRDITDQKRADQLSRERKELLEGILHYTPFSVMVRDRYNRYLYVNDQFEKTTGLSAEQVLGKTPRDFLGNDHVNENILQYDRKVLESGEPLEMESTMIALGQEYNLLSIRAPLLDSNNRPYAVCVINKDITEKKRMEKALQESEERYRRISEYITDYIFTVRMRNGWPGEAVHSPASVAVTGYQPEEFESDPSLWSRAVHETDRIAVQDQVSRVLQGQDTCPIEHRIVRKDGQIRWVNNTLVPHYDREGNLIAYDNLIRDITEQKNFEEEKGRLQTQLQQAQKMEAIGTLAGGIAHDFNNILSIIVGNVELALLDVPENLMGRRNLEKALTASLRARDLVKQILAFSRQSEKNLVSCDLRPLIKESMRLLRASIPTSVEIRQSISPEVRSIMTDPTQINQILINLCSNAAHAMNKDGGILEIGLEDIEIDAQNVSFFSDLLPGRYVKLSVRDTGHGMMPDIMDKVFDPYFTTKKVGEGTGMGLAVVHGIIKNHGGEIKVSSTVGEGTQFDMYFPSIDKASAKDQKPQKVDMPIGKEHILVVDDEEAIGQMTKEILERFGYHVTLKMDSMEAFEVFCKDPDRFDLMLTDQTMPQMTGVKLAKKVKDIRPYIPIILSTGHNELVNEMAHKNAGIDHCIRKPFIIRELTQQIRSVLDDVSGAN